MKIQALERHHKLILFTVVAAYSLILYYFMFRRYINLEMREPTDSAAYMQVAWSVIFGTPFTTTIQESFISCFPHNFLGDQLMFTLALFSPLFFFFSSGKTFLVLQILIISIGAIFLYSFAYCKLKRPLIPLLVTVCYLFNPATIMSFIEFGFRAETIFIPCIFALFLCMLKKRQFLAVLCVVFCLLTKHNAILIVFMLGVYILAFERASWRFGIFCLIGSFAYYIMGVEIVMAAFQENPTAHFKHLAQFGDTPLKALLHMISNPVSVLELISEEKIAHLFLIFFPAGILSVVNPVFWVCSPELVINMAMDDYLAVIAGWHWTFVIPFIFVGMVSTIDYIFNKWKEPVSLRKAIHIFVLCLLAFDIVLHVNNFNESVVKKRNTFFLKRNRINPHSIIDRFSIIEPDASVMVSAQLLWFFFNRAHVYTARTKFHDEVDYIVLLLPIGWHGHYKNIDKYIISEIKASIEPNMTKFRNFDVILHEENLLILKNSKSLKDISSGIH